MVGTAAQASGAAVTGPAPDVVPLENVTKRPHDRYRLVRRALWPLGFAVGLAALGPTLLRDGVGSLDAFAVLYLFVGWSFVASGLVGWSRRPENRVGRYIVAVGFLWFAAGVLTQSGNSLVFSIGVWLGDLWLVAWMLLLLAFPSGRLGAGIDRLILVGLVVPVLPMELAWLLFLEEEEGPANAFLVWPNATVADAIDIAQRVIILAALTVLTIVLARRWLRASEPLRRVMVPVVVGMIAVVLFAVVLVIDTVSGGRSAFFDWLFLLVLTWVPITFLAGLLRARLARSAVGDLLVELRRAPARGELRDALARALHDPDVAILYWVPEYKLYVDSAGRPANLAAEAEGRAVTLVEQDGRDVAAVVHDPLLREEPELVGAVCAAAGIALENERLQADLRARLEELRGSRARIVEAADSERRRLERNLHDGAQQRLVTVAVGLRLAASRLEEGSEAAELLAGAREELAASVRELRELAQGIHPAVLTDHGLDVALETLAAHAPLPVRVQVGVSGRLPEAIEVAAYYLVSESLANVAKYAAASAASVDVSRSNGRLVVEVADDGAGGADPARGSGLRGLADRVESLGGRVRVWSPVGEGTRVRAEIPCG